MIKRLSVVNLAFILVSLILAVNAHAFKLPDTGQTLCYGSLGNVIDCTGTREDGDYTINPMSYADNGNGTVTDNNTGLIWQKQDDGNSYTWDQAVTYCGSLSLGGQTDWRLPSKKELIGIVDYNIPFPGPTISAVFNNTHSDIYWTGTVSASNPGQAAAVLFFIGWVGYADKQSSVFPFPPLPDIHSYARCVRGGQYPQQQLIDNGNGTVTDAASGLVWQQTDPGFMTWESALSYCKGLSFANNTDWRLPNIKEIESLTDDVIFNPSINIAFFPTAQADRYWSSTTELVNPTYADNVEFADGHVGDRDKSGFLYTRCVRGGQFGSLSKLDITLTGDGTGTVMTNPRSIDCGSGCSALLFPLNSIVTLQTMSGPGSSVFSGWGGDLDCTDGQVTMNVNKNCTATFSTCVTDIARIGLSSYQTIADAYGAIPSSAPVTIELIAYNTSEVLTFSDNKNITLHGGFDCGYTLQPFSFTTIASPLTIAGGSVVADSIAIL